ncbi:glycerol-3-phosphate dehydrogenase [Roseomonas marmotae]|uniref:Glycerol-3-phosphate dehydrogenase n=1 Tax=Roseomonas marmotae TaxID=2768161 RepID=A0ABS3KIC0_9PROT|nr:glycerol-3-phosphate dehydrogenase [Roseomonas marmotae]MBO1077218.1 glycerol-3-phosphate dehydrogenase [Roseomonas marmotae]QTI81147.1 glycerol-3-phosphate dehydrogenase [Roseomonas marmotae]
MAADVLDLLVIGGGANGAGIARDAAGRGLSVLLAERGDLAGATSSASSKLIHGGLRYLEHREFRLVREALAEREVLLRAAPHIIWPMRFVLPHEPQMRPRWMLRAGLFLYDNLARRVTLPASQSLDLRRHPWGAPLRKGLAHGFAYSDAWVEDARLVVLNARDAAARGAEICVRTEFVSARRGVDYWTCALRDTGTGAIREMRARAIANAAGPWVMQALDATGVAAPDKVRLVRGSHIVLPALYEGEQAYILQNDDRRVVFVIPYEGRFTLVGTTDVPHDPADGPPRCTPEEAAYLCRAVSRAFRRPIAPDEVVWSYSGVRPLHDDGASDPSAVTRDYVLKLDRNGPPMLSVFGGKITTYRRLAEDVVTQLAGALGKGGNPWTAGAALPGGDLGGLSAEGFIEEAARRYPFLDAALLRRLFRCYGSELDRVLGHACSAAELGQHLGGGITERELEWMRAEEWVRDPEDALWRRTKRGLHMTQQQRDSFAGFFAQNSATAMG